MTICSHRLPLAAALSVIAGAAICWQPPGVLGAECSGDYGTEVDFVDSPAEAAKLATKLEKLVFVLHVSGEFEDSKYT